MGAKKVADKPVIKEYNEAKPLQDMKVLLVEDNPVNILVAQKFLERWGAKTEVAHNGVEALEAIKSKSYEIILMDMHMPIMDGYEATREIRKMGISTPIIALTASVYNEDRGHMFSLGVNDYIVKPFNPDELCRTVLKYTQGAAMVAK